MQLLFKEIIGYLSIQKNTDGSFTVADSNSFLSPLKILPIAQENKYFYIFKEIRDFHHANVCCMYLLELPHEGNSNEHTQYKIIL